MQEVRNRAGVPPIRQPMNQDQASTSTAVQRAQSADPSFYLSAPALPDPGPTCWRDGDRLVTPHITVLPHICVRCGQPASKRVSVKLTWHSRWWYLLLLLSLWVYVIVALLIRKKATLELSLCEPHARSRRRGRRAGWATMIAGAAVLFVATPLALALGLLLIVAGAIAVIVTSRIITAHRMDDLYVWIDGVHGSIVRRTPSIR